MNLALVEVRKNIKNVVDVNDLFNGLLKPFAFNRPFFILNVVGLSSKF